MTDELSEHLAEGARHGLHVAIRRGDVELALRCLQHIWNHQPSKVWLLWHLPTIVLSESWYLLPYVKKLVETNPDGSYNAAVSFVRMMALNTKSRDVSCLLRLMLYVKTTTLERLMRGHANTPVPDDVYLQHAEYQAMLTNFEMGPVTYLETAGRKLTKFEQDAMDWLLEGATGSGTVNRKYLYMAGVVLLNMRGISDKKVQGVVAETKKKRLPKLKDDPLPWYCYGPGTSMANQVVGAMVGKDGLVTVDKVKLPPHDILALWQVFEDEPAKIVAVEPKRGGKRTCFETLWWEPLRLTAGAVNGLTIEQSADLWETVKPTIQKAIEAELQKGVF